MAATHFSGPVVSTNGFQVASGTILTGVLKGTVSVTVAAILAAAEADVEVSIANVAVGDSVQVNAPNASMETGLGVLAVWVSEAGKIKIRMTNASGSTLTGSTSDWTYLVLKS